MSYRITGGIAGLNQTRLEVTEDGRAVATRLGEQAIHRLSPWELHWLRKDLIRAFGGRSGTFGPLCCDFIYHQVEVAGNRGRTRSVSFVPGSVGPWADDVMKVLERAIERIFAEGTVEEVAPPPGPEPWIPAESA